MANRILVTVSGLILIAGGVLALLMPVVASLTATLIVGWTFFIAAVLHIVQAFRTSEDRLWHIGFGLLGLFLGVSFIFNPLGGMLSLTIVLGGTFLAYGLMQLYLVWKRRKTDSVWMMALSGIVSIALAALIVSDLFAASVTVPGLVLAIELISTGVALLLLKPRQDSEKVAQESADTGAEQSA